MISTSSSGVIRLHDCSHPEDMVNWPRYCIYVASFFCCVLPCLTQQDPALFKKYYPAALCVLIGLE